MRDDDNLVGEFVRSDPPLLEEPIERLERDRLAGSRHYGGKDAVADQRIGQHETGGVEEAGVAPVKFIELASGNRQAAMTKKLRVSLEAQAHAPRAVELAAKTGGDEAVAVGVERRRRRSAGNDRPAEEDLAVTFGVALRAELDFREDGAVAIFLEVDLAERERRWIARRLALQHDACEIAERIEIEEFGGPAEGNRQTLDLLHPGPHRAGPSQAALGPLRHAVLGKFGKDGGGKRRHRRPRGDELIGEDGIVEGMMLGERGAANQPRQQPERKPDRPGQRIGVEDHVAGVEVERQHRHRPLRQKLVLVARDCEERPAGPGSKGDQGRAYACRGLDLPQAPAGVDRLIEGDDALGQTGSEAEHEAHRELIGRDCAQRLRRGLSCETGDPDQRFGFDLGASLADLVSPPQHRQCGDREPGAPGGEQRQRREREIGELHGDGIAGPKAKLDEGGGERVHRRVGLLIGEGTRNAEAKRLTVGGIGERHDIGLLDRPAPEQPFRRQRDAVLFPLDVFSRERAHPSVTVCP